eukprot:SRR837773.5932.p2 GENE.SRR837773.5932~~SRR837773.5932.p2  ORF type:complete len:180 (+),score=21.56 SRR837773.5932:27-542(+)
MDGGSGPPPMPGGSFGSLAPPPPQANDPFRVLSPEDKEYLEGLGRRISLTVLSCAVLGGGGAYGLARHLNWRRVKLTAFFGATITPIIGWSVVITQEKERTMPVFKKLHMAASELESREAAAAANRGDANAAIARLFPPPPTMGMGGMGMPPGGFAPPGGFRPPGTGGSSF